MNSPNKTSARRWPSSGFLPGSAFLLLVTLLATLWLAGGASREDALGQLVVRSAAWIALGVAVVAGPRPKLEGSLPVALLILAALALPIVQLVPLPPVWWQSLPNRAALVDAARIAGEKQPWRPWSMAPGETWNALLSLVIPVAVLVLLLQSGPRERRWLIAVLLVLVVAATIFGLIQFSRFPLENMFINDTPGAVSANFANRNHTALFLAMGCLIAPVWALDGSGRQRMRALGAVGLMLIFSLTILATGSRAGILLGALALVIAPALVWPALRQLFDARYRWALPALLGSLLAVAMSLVVISSEVGRADSINRALTMTVDQDMRSRALPTVMALIKAYFPVGSGLGGFDPIFRLNEPLDLLKPTYFNHAHNDYLEVALDAGLAGIALLTVALSWWAYASIKVWRATFGPELQCARLGSSILLLIIIASLFDYPARTPMVMALATISAFWLSSGAKAVASRRARGKKTRSEALT
jgi:O-antigen ligase